tara:strand:+ start:849 stop:1169 length:321 start_codon:yes stop_codon:yes gene_type:complete
MIQVTDLAAGKIRQSIKRRGKGLGIRLGVKTTGCSGLAYVMEYVDSPLHTDITTDIGDFSVYVDPTAQPYLTDITVDYVRKGLNEGFEFINPIERDRCGCGESFRV